ncbi:MAG: hypothetical protein H6622_00560 [Halobacteriovoraceae bacterium]|nr:hypothetical protein [Halobacteriovoraceae bacterium]
MKYFILFIIFFHVAKIAIAAKSTKSCEENFIEKDTKLILYKSIVSRNNKKDHLDLNEFEVLRLEMMRLASQNKNFNRKKESSQFQELEDLLDSLELEGLKIFVMGNNDVDKTNFIHRLTNSDAMVRPSDNVLPHFVYYTSENAGIDPKNVQNHLNFSGEIQHSDKIDRLFIRRRYAFDEVLRSNSKLSIYIGNEDFPKGVSFFNAPPANLSVAFERNGELSNFSNLLNQSDYVFLHISPVIDKYSSGKNSLNLEAIENSLMSQLRYFEYDKISLKGKNIFVFFDDGFADPNLEVGDGAKEIIQMVEKNIKSKEDKCTVSFWSISKDNISKVDTHGTITEEVFSLLDDVQTKQLVDSRFKENNQQIATKFESELTHVYLEQLLNESVDYVILQSLDLLIKQTSKDLELKLSKELKDKLYKLSSDFLKTNAYYLPTTPGDISLAIMGLIPIPKFKVMADGLRKGGNVAGNVYDNLKNAVAFTQDEVKEIQSIFDTFIQKITLTKKSNNNNIRLNETFIDRQILGIVSSRFHQTIQELNLSLRDKMVVDFFNENESQFGEHQNREEKGIDPILVKEAIQRRIIEKFTSHSPTQKEIENGKYQLEREIDQMTKGIDLMLRTSEHTKIDSKDENPYVAKVRKKMINSMTNKMLLSAPMNACRDTAAYSTVFLTFGAAIAIWINYTDHLQNKKGYDKTHSEGIVSSSKEIENLIFSGLPLITGSIYLIIDRLQKMATNRLTACTIVKEVSSNFKDMALTNILGPLKEEIEGPKSNTSGEHLLNLERARDLSIKAAISTSRIEKLQLSEKENEEIEIMINEELRKRPHIKEDELNKIVNKIIDKVISENRK